MRYLHMSTATTIGRPVSRTGRAAPSVKFRSNFLRVSAIGRVSPFFPQCDLSTLRAMPTGPVHHELWKRRAVRAWLTVVADAMYLSWTFI
jgi:hypothetical protein